MPTVTAEVLHRFVRDILVAVDVPTDRAEMVTEHLVEANLTGHDSHGAIRLRRYIPLIEQGKIVPDAPIEVHDETETTAVVDGNWGLGFVVTRFAADLAATKARASGVAAITVRQQSHMGRLGWYSGRIAEQGLIGFVTADSGRAPKSVAPLGGRSRRLGTNPLSFAVPADVEGAVILDMATSTVAHGKIRVAAARGEQIPEGWVVDEAGNPTTDPNAMERGGALLPFGADQAHKGYALSFMVEVFSGLLTGIGFSHDPGGFSNDGAFVSAFSVERFRPLDTFRREMRDFIHYLKESPLATGHEEILYPGELEHRVASQRRASGIDIEQDTWDRLVEMADRVGAAVP